MSIFGWLRGGAPAAPTPPKKKRRARLPRGWVRYAKTVYKRTPASNARGRQALEKQGYRLVK